jgi:uncharacterized protein YndB with AHSA1/START domain
MSEETTRSVDHQYLIRTTPERLYEAFASPAGLVKWLADTAELTPRKGTRYSLGWTNGPTHRGEVLDSVPGRSLTLSWEWPGVELKGTTFHLEAEPAEGGTLFVIRHTGFPREEKWTDLYGGAEWGWTYFAMNLKSVLETGRDLRTPRDG